MPKFPVIYSKDAVKALEKLGFEIIRTTGSHIRLKKDDKLVSIPFHNKDLTIGTLKSILRQADITVEELQKNL